MTKVTFLIKFKGGNMKSKKTIKVVRAGKKVIPCLKRTTKKAIVSTKKSYPYK